MEIKTSSNKPKKRTQKLPDNVKKSQAHQLYKINTLINRDFFGTLYGTAKKKEDVMLAVKVLKSEYTFSPEKLKGIRHKNVCNVVKSYVESDKTKIIVMEKPAGRSLNDLLKRNDTMDIPLAISMVIQLLSALNEFHKNGQVLENLSIDSLFLHIDEKNTVTLKLINVGIASTRQSRRNARHLAPEQIALPPKTDVRSDIWAIGTILYQLIYGQPVFDGISYSELTRKIRTQKIDYSNPQLEAPEGLIHLVMRALDRNPEKRYQSTNDMLKDVLKLQKLYNTTVSDEVSRAISICITADLPRFYLDDTPPKTAVVPPPMPQKDKNQTLLGVPAMVPLKKDDKKLSTTPPSPEKQVNKAGRAKPEASDELTTHSLNKETLSKLVDKAAKINEDEEADSQSSLAAEVSRTSRFPGRGNSRPSMFPSDWGSGRRELAMKIKLLARRPILFVSILFVIIMLLVVLITVVIMQSAVDEPKVVIQKVPQAVSVAVPVSAPMPVPGASGKLKETEEEQSDKIEIQDDQLDIEQSDTSTVSDDSEALTIVTITLKNIPDNAVVTVNEEEQPAPLELTRSDDPVMLRVTASRYWPFKKEIVPNSDQTIKVEMARKKRRARKKNKTAAKKKSLATNPF